MKVEIGMFNMANEEMFATRQSQNEKPSLRSSVKSLENIIIQGTKMKQEKIEAKKSPEVNQPVINPQPKVLKKIE